MRAAIILMHRAVHPCDTQLLFILMADSTRTFCTVLGYPPAMSAVLADHELELRERERDSAEGMANPLDDLRIKVRARLQHPPALPTAPPEGAQHDRASARPLGRRSALSSPQRA